MAEKKSPPAVEIENVADFMDAHKASKYDIFKSIPNASDTSPKCAFIGLESGKSPQHGHWETLIETGADFEWEKLEKRFGFTPQIYAEILSPTGRKIAEKITIPDEPTDEHHLAHLVSLGEITPSEAEKIQIAEQKKAKKAKKDEIAELTGQKKKPGPKPKKKGDDEPEETPENEDESPENENTTNDGGDDLDPPAETAGDDNLGPPAEDETPEGENTTNDGDARDGE